jgi:hypothetical protein
MFQVIICIGLEEGEVEEQVIIVEERGRWRVRYSEAGQLFLVVTRCQRPKEAKQEEGWF